MAALFFPMECAPYCLKINKPEQAMFILYLIFLALCCTVGPQFFDAPHIFKFYSLPWSFRYKLGITCFAGVAAYYMLRIYVRKLVLWLEANKVHGDPHD